MKPSFPPYTSLQHTTNPHRTSMAGSAASTVSNFGDDSANGDAEDDAVMATIDRAACEIVRARSGSADGLDTVLTAERRLRVPLPNLDDYGNDNSSAAQRPCTDATVSDILVADMAPMALSAMQKRGKDEVDVAAEGISLGVRRFQWTKSTLALQEATKNDATLQSSKLVDYFVSLTKNTDGLYTEKEMCGWLVAQMCDRVATGQVWVVAKTHKLMSALLWRGSNSFVAAVHDYGAALFQVSHLVTKLKSTPQENLSGTPLQSQLQPIESASAAQKANAVKARSHPNDPFGKARDRAREVHSANISTVGGQSFVSVIPADEMTCLMTSVAYQESLCEYRVRHPTLDLTHCEILTTKPGATKGDGDACKQCDPSSPELWKELLDDTLELMKAIAVTDPYCQIGPLGAAAATEHVRESVVLYQVACRALVRLLHAAVAKFHTFIAALQVGLQLPSSNDFTPSSPVSALVHSMGGDPWGNSFDPGALDFSVTPEYVHKLSTDYYNAVYQFNRTVHMLRDYCETAQHLERETAKKAVAAFKALPESNILAFKESRRVFSHPMCQNTMATLHRAAQHYLHQRTEEGSSRAAAAAEAPPTDPPTMKPSFSDPPISDDEVRHSLRALYDFHTANGTFKENVWVKQVTSVCNLFDKDEAAILHQIFSAGLTGLYEQWQDFTNNGAAAAEKALMASGEANRSSPTRSGGAMRGATSTDDGVSDTLTKSSTYILRSLRSDAQLRRSSSPRTDVMYLKHPPSQICNESAIDALLQEDDVVVICNEECSCNDTMKLVDRFQVLMDVPLGEGSYGRVYRAWDEAIGCYLAVKELPLDASKAHNIAVREVLQEYTVLTELSHPNIVRVVAFMVLKRTARIYMEWVPSGSLQDVLRHHPRGMLRESVVRRYARDVLSGLAFLHSRGVIHRDVKPGNMLLSSDGAVKLTDFGTSLVLSGNHRTLESGSVTGTAAYMAPECVQGTYSSASDIWSFGCSVVQLIGGQVPWCSPTSDSMPEPIALLFKVGCLDDATHLERPHDALKAAAKAAAEARGEEASSSVGSVPSSDSGAVEKPRVKDAVSAELLEMLDAIFVVDRKKRPSASELLQHPFFNTLQDRS